MSGEKFSDQEALRSVLDRHAARVKSDAVSRPERARGAAQHPLGRILQLNADLAENNQPSSASVSAPLFEERKK